jgi:hypothetical protein
VSEAKVRRLNASDPRNFWRRVDTTSLDGCWPWLGGINTWGYGAAQFRGKYSNSSRVAAFLSHGEVPENLVVCHACDNPLCCRPSHLFIATQAENLKDCRDKGRAVYRVGVQHHRATAKITAAQVLDARKAYSEGETQTSIARRLGVHSATISRAVRGEVWRDAEALVSP